MEQTGKQLHMLIKDNGSGFNVCDVTTGNGLQNMRYRAGEIQATVAIESSPGNGTTVLLKLPVP
jgi:signal transduction histidine kinase